MTSGEDCACHCNKPKTVLITVKAAPRMVDQGPGMMDTRFSIHNNAPTRRARIPNIINFWWWWSRLCSFIRNLSLAQEHVERVEHREGNTEEVFRAAHTLKYSFLYLNRAEETSQFEENNSDFTLSRLIPTVTAPAIWKTARIIFF